MPKKLLITISDEMHDEIRRHKKDLRGWFEEKTISSVCRDAISEFLKEARASRKYRMAGIKDGKQIAASFSAEDKEYISKVLKKDGPYKKWSEFKKIERLKTHFEETQKRNIATIYPQFIKIMDQVLPPLDSWVKTNN